MSSCRNSCVNGNAAIAIDNDFLVNKFGNVVSVSTIIQLNEGDRVEVLCTK